MKLIEGMKTLRVLEKRMATNSQRINQYASILSSERPLFSTEAQQRQEVKSLIQANEDLAKEYLELKKRVDLTNIKTQVQISKRSFSISDLLVIKRGIAKLMRQTYQALNDGQATTRLQATRGQFSGAQTGEKGPRIERLYEEKDKIAGLQEWQDLEDEIETRLEVINATTDLVEL